MIWKGLAGIIFIVIFAFISWNSSKYLSEEFMYFILGVMVFGFGFKFIKDNHRFYGYSMIGIAVFFLVATVLI
ncbi:hypothetical protein [Alkalibacillus almallahensis]|uniref:hypothetical protein n=1 Tax=Alkalibacillus almallahensis TaxID=1379154 RepID=UPI001421A100|nr:hypothetical protein [Alkalibacillus almallahensis]NIK12572.1 hypothetical protein [Alkalibacillus almallahensis]